MKLIAHKTESGQEQYIYEHSKNVGEMAKNFVKTFHNEDWAYYAGMLHDLGKADKDWQRYIRGEKNTSVNHSEAGAQFAYSKLNPSKNPREPFSKVLPYIIAGHHAGLPDWNEGSGNSLKSILGDDVPQKLLELPELQEILSAQMPKSTPFGKNDLKKENPQELLEHFHLWIRMLYSCLVDADFLDTEQFMQPEQTALRGKYASLAELKTRFDEYMAEKTRNAPSSRINEIRAAVLRSCREKAKLPPGFYSLNVPTGGGKTLSSMAFALEHALAHGKRRIIMAIPYTSIIEQTAKVYKYGTDDDSEIAERKKAGKWLFGEENVLEHHCNFDFEKDDEGGILAKQKLAAENWDAPIVVTTNV